jgi:hypothetical protein
MLARDSDRVTRLPTCLPLRLVGFPLLILRFPSVHAPFVLSQDYRMMLNSWLTQSGRCKATYIVSQYHPPNAGLCQAKVSGKHHSHSIPRYLMVLDS